MYGLIGEKLSHSYSERIHRAFGLYEYRLWELPPSQVREFILHGEWQGLNVTIPYKKVACECCDILSPEARRVHAVNTLVRDADGKLHGYNTDYAGFLSLAQAIHIIWPGRKVLILGTGGAACTVSDAIAQQGAAEVVLVSRHGPVDYQNLYTLHADCQILINATPCGMFPNIDARPVDLARLPRLQAVLDLIYNPPRTLLLQQAASLGIPHANGLHMLVEQARRAAEIFVRSPLPPSLTPTIMAQIAR